MKMHRYRKGRWPKGLAAIVLLLCLGTTSRAVVLDRFEGPSAPAPWTFSNGPEFPGATGSLSRGTGYAGFGAHLAYDTSAGGNYVAAVYTLPAPVAASVMSLWVKSPGGVSVQVRVNDSTGQTLQYSPTRPFESTDAAQWYQLVIRFAPTLDHFGGANDGILHGAITGVSVMAKPGTTKAGAIDFDSVKLTNRPAASINPASPSLAAPVTADFRGSLGVQITHADATAVGLELVQSLGFSYISTEMFWGDVETTMGVYDFTYYDQLLASLKSHGLQAQWTLCYGNPLYTGAVFLDPPRTPEAIQAFAAFAKAAAVHYAGQGMRFEVWNEPDIAAFWNPPDATAYSSLCQAASTQIHLGDPAAVVITGGLAGIDLGFLDGMIAAGGINTVDAVGVHPYRLEAPEQLTGDLLDLRTHLAAAPLRDTPAVWSTEAGYSSAWYGDGGNADNRTKQAKFSVRQMLTGLALGLPSQTFFDLRDTGMDTTMPEENFGLVDNAYQSKPLTVAVQTLLDQCKGRTFAGILASPASDVHVLKFAGPTDTLLVVWSEASAGTPQRIYFSEPPGQALDYLGNPLNIVNGGAKSGSLKIKDSPVYVTFPGSL